MGVPSHLLTNRPLAARSTQDAVRRSTPSFREVRSELHHALTDLVAQVADVSDCSADGRVAVDRLVGLASTITSANSVETKHEMRQALWSLRQSFQKQPQDAPLAVRASFERTRSVCLDNTFESHLRSYPSARYEVRPRMHEVANFHRVSPHVMRGAMPTQGGADWLHAHHVGTVVDLTFDESDSPWAPVTFTGAAIHHFPVRDYTAPTYEQLHAIIKVLDGATADNQVFVHCRAGIGRTGVAIACWRITHGWSAEDAIAAEALQSYDAALSQAQAVRDFEARWKHEQAGGHSVSFAN